MGRKDVSNALGCVLKTRPIAFRLRCHHLSLKSPVMRAGSDPGLLTDFQTGESGGNLPPRSRQCKLSTSRYVDQYPEAPEKGPFSSPLSSMVLDFNTK